ncbi:MAG: hypothetical protein RIR26_2546 [Pseudomonadota bacterium]
MSETSPRLANRLSHAARLWQEYAHAPMPRQLDRWMSERLRAEKKFGSQDRRFYSDILFSAARVVSASLFRKFLIERGVGQDLVSLMSLPVDRCLELVNLFSESTRTEDQLWAAIREMNPQTVVHDAFAELHLENEPTGDLLSWRRQWGTQMKSIAVTEAAFQNAIPLLLLAHGIPSAWSDRFSERVKCASWTSDEVIRFLHLQNERAPLWIRLNHPEKKTLVDEDLKAHDLDVNWLENGVSAVVSGAFGVYQCDTFKSGFFEVQDRASQQIAESVAARPGEKVWDTCAGGGGKSVALASSLQGKGALYASDIRVHKLEEAKRRCQRAGFHNIRTLSWDGREPPAFGKEVHIQNGFDAVLVDAPCSSSGTWRRNPDARLRVSDTKSFSELNNLQHHLLSEAARWVRPGGRLVYGTCSWCCEENENIVRTFLESKNGVFRNATEGAQGQLFGAATQNSDTMFAAVFVRV